MCDPITITAVATAALGVGQAIESYQGQKAAYKVNEQVANLNYASRSNVETQKGIQLDQEKSENALDTAIATVRAQGEVANSAASMGLGSSSIVQALNADMFGIGRQAMTEETNDQNQRIQIANERYGAQIERASTISSKTDPNLLDLGLGVGAGVLKGVSTYSSMGGKF